ncbi:uncharacterized protein LOC144536679 [Sander vitreus]
MVGHQLLPWMNNPTSGSISATSAKKEQEIYNNKSDKRPGWKSLLFDYQNISDGYLALTTVNNDLRRDNQLLQEHGARLHGQNQLLNRTADDLMSVNLALSFESAELMEQIGNLTSLNLHLAQEHERLLRHTSEQESKELNKSQTIKHLVDSNAQREQEVQRLSDVSGLLRDELVRAKERNQGLLEINDEFRGEVQNLSEKIGALSSAGCAKASERSTQLQERPLQEQKQNLSAVLMKERREAAERDTSRRNELQSIKEAYNSLDLYCPVVNLNTKERICKKCPDSWHQHETKCYYFSSQQLTWSSSRAWCQTRGGDLLVINSQPEQLF